MMQGPIHYENLDKKGKIINNPKGLVNPTERGIYVWGFMYNYDGSFKNPINFSDKNILENYYANGCKLPDNWKFLPYYVGKKEGNIFKRIKTHHNVRHGDAAKYIRLSYDYLIHFFKDPKFPIKYNRVRNINQTISKFQDDPNSIEYFNRLDFLNLKYPKSILKGSGRKLTDYPITEQKDFLGTQLKDTLDEIVNSNNNFWFCFLPVDEIYPNLTEYESFVFWSLKGMTVSQTERYQKINNTISIVNNTGLDIFNVNKNNKIIPTEIFNGY
jgi:hypothetical protein